MRFKCPFCNHEPFLVFWALKQHIARDHVNSYCPACKLSGVRGIESHLIQMTRIEISKVPDVMTAKKEEILHVILYGLVTRSKIFSYTQAKLLPSTKELATIVAFNQCICKEPDRTDSCAGKLAMSVQAQPI